MFQADISCASVRRGGGLLDLNQHTVLLRLWKLPQDSPRSVIHRVHIDLANSGQPGSWSHLQLGGRTVPSEEQWYLPEETGEVRWPSSLFDVILASELIIYTFWPETWAELANDSAFSARVRKSESAMVKPFFNAWDSYQRNFSGTTFLGSICNQRSRHPWTASSTGS
jgi:hypothetical protein